jgi:hypothetical protein
LTHNKKKKSKANVDKSNNKPTVKITKEDANLLSESINCTVNNDEELPIKQLTAGTG